LNGPLSTQGKKKRAMWRERGQRGRRSAFKKRVPRDIRGERKMGEPLLRRFPKKKEGQASERVCQTCYEEKQAIGILRGGISKKKKPGRQKNRKEKKRGRRGRTRKKVFQFISSLGKKTANHGQGITLTNRPLQREEGKKEAG